MQEYMSLGYEPASANDQVVAGVRGMRMQVVMLPRLMAPALALLLTAAAVNPNPQTLRLSSLKSSYP